MSLIPTETPPGDYEAAPAASGDALLVVDMQVAAVAGTWRAASVTATIADLVARARLAGTPVVWIRDQADLEVGSPGWEIVADLPPEPGEAIVEKRYGDAFAETELADVLATAGAGHVWITGAHSDACVRSTLFGALYRGLDATLVEDAHTTKDKSYEHLPLAAEQLVAVVNRLAWTTRLPGVTCHVCRATDIDFHPAHLDDDDLLEAVEADEQAEEDAEDVQLGLADPDPEQLG